MSTRRRLERKREPGARSHSRWRKRLGLACRADHWRALWSGRTLDDWGGPVDQDRRVAFVTARCRKHRIQAASVVSITRIEEDRVSSPLELADLLQRKVADGLNLLWREVTPTQVRRTRPFPDPEVGL